MRFVYDINTLSLERTHLLLLTEDVKYLRRMWIPRRFLHSAFREFSKDFAELFNERAFGKMFENRVLQTLLFNKINTLYPSIYYALSLNLDSKVKDYYKELFGKYPETADDLYLILQEIKRLTYKYKEMFETEQDKPGPVDFEGVVVSVEVMLGINIPRTMKCYQFKRYFDLAMKKATANG